MTSATGKQSSRGAFTLVEILVSVTILSFGIVSVMALFDVCLSGLSTSGDRLHAALLMKETISIAELEGPGGASGGRFQGDDAGFSWTFEMGPASRQSGAAVNEAVVSVWRDGREQAVYSLTTWLAMKRDN